MRGTENVLQEIKHMHGHVLLLTVKHDQSLEVLRTVPSVLL
jgi:hypothetical protein